MKRPFTLLCSVLFVLLASHTTLFAQAGSIHTVAGGGTSTADGVLATAAALSTPRSVGVDAAGNLYFVENGAYRITKVDASTGLISTVAGNGTWGFSGDGGPATSAQLGNVVDIFVDPIGNIYISDRSACRIRKVDAGTGNINTVVGGGTLLADGVPATATNIGYQNFVYVDDFGNIYCFATWLSGAPGGNYCLRKVDAVTGIITTIAGGGMSMSDGVPATSEWFAVDDVQNMCMDSYGNIYILQMGRIRKIDAVTGIINTISGAGTSDADGIPAINAANFGSSNSIKTDIAGNLFIPSGGRIKRIDAATGIINTIAGGGTNEAEGAWALSALINPYYLCLDAAHNVVYFSTTTHKVRKLANTPMAGASSSSLAGSFSVNINRLCNGPEITIFTPGYVSGSSIKTYFGDGTIDSSTLLPVTIICGYTTIHHTYHSAGTYAVKQVLFSGATRIDSISYSYSYSFCRAMPVKLFFDANSNCIFDASETYSGRPILIEVDSNGTNIKTISATSEFVYNAYSVPGDIYNFKVLPTSSGISAICPSSGIITDTVFSATVIHPEKYFGLSCPTSGMYDNSIHAVVPVTGVHDQWANIYIGTTSCIATDATVTLHYSKKYKVDAGLGGGIGVDPLPAAYSDSTITWDLTGLSSDTPVPFKLYYAIWSNPTTGYLTIGDTVHSYYTVTPISGDSNPSNNSETRIDTVKAGCDPNEIFVSPANCLAAGTSPDTLQYTIHFENTGNDTAHNIYVMDTLSANIDPSSLRIIMASASMNIQMLKDYGYNIVRFDFPKINLLDSSHHGLCDGAVIFSAVTRPGLAFGTQISNRAGIYFDINPVVMTNTVQNIKGCPAAGLEQVVSRQQTVVLYPNPATDELTIQTTPSIFTSFTISNSMGQVVMQQDMSGAQTKVDVKALVSGLYFVTLRGGEGNEVQKFIKW